VGTLVADEVEGLRALGVEIEVLYVNRKAEGRRVYARLPRALRREVLDHEPDLVHVMYGGVMADIATRTVVDRPVLVSFCGTDLLGGAEGSLRDRFSRRKSSAASRRAALRAAGVVVKSRNLRGALPEGVDEDRIWIIPDGVDTDRFFPADRDEARARLGWTAPGAHVLFPASPERPEKNFPLAEGAVAELGRRGQPATLHVLASIPYDDVPLWFNAADVVLMTSRHEGSPVAIKEALACGTPIVSVDVGDVRERIEGLEGCHIVAADPEALADALADVLKTAKRIDGRKRADEVSLATVTPQLLEVYRTLAA
jgi:glycosyltransferase involved in cell wall biosynthesis